MTHELEGSGSLGECDWRECAEDAAVEFFEGFRGGVLKERPTNGMPYFVFRFCEEHAVEYVLVQEGVHQ